ncbi:MAG: helicase family protein of unknown function [Streptomyces oryziradicis]|nr:helicase family protein of unknown function [Actinacidiphila oryziradicis]
MPRGELDRPDGYHRRRARGQLAAPRAAPLDVEGLINRLVGDPHGLVIGEVDPEPARGLLGTPRRCPAQVLAAGLRDAAWDEDILELLEEDEPDSDLTRLAKKIAARGKRAPRLRLRTRQPRLAGRLRLARLRHQSRRRRGPADHDSEEHRNRDAAYTADGWTVRTASDWLDRLETVPLENTIRAVTAPLPI